MKKINAVTKLVAGLSIGALALGGCSSGDTDGDDGDSDSTATDETKTKTDGDANKGDKEAQCGGENGCTSDEEKE